METKWNIFSSLSASKEASVVNALLLNRGFNTAQIEKILNVPALSEYLQELPLEFKQSLKEATTLVRDAIQSNIPIVIHGDYDADGISATAILYSTIKDELSYNNVYYFIPNRFDHGYGISKKSIDAVMSRYNLTGKSILFITVDSGITALAETDYVRSLGHTIIITDHHQKPAELPRANCIVWNDKIVGATVAWLFSRFLGSKNPQLLSLAALATVTDLQPVLDLNRAVLKKGLEILNSNPVLGIKKLLQISGKKETEITSYDLGWLIGPRLNASGRLVEAEESLKLLLEKDETALENLALKLNQINTLRQDKTFEMYELALFNKDNLPKILFSTNEAYHEGIIGLVAARLAQTYYRPAIVVSMNGEHAKGSVRSIKGINIIEFLRKFNDMFESLGGHPMAAGFTVKKDLLPDLQKNIQDAALESIDDSLLVPSLDIDMQIPLELVSNALADELDQLKPFGLGNEEPVFMSSSVRVTDVTFVGKEKQHCSMKFMHNSKTYKGIYFNFPKDQLTLPSFGDVISIVYTLKASEFNGTKTTDLFIKDFKFI